MSLVSLQSQTDQFPYDFNNDFKQGITLKKGSKVELVHSVIHKKKNLTIDANNNTFKFIIGDPQKYITKIITIPNGSYNPDTFADLITLKMNEQQVLGIYKGAFKCDYAIVGDKETFTITFAENPLPALSSNTWTEYAPTKTGGASVVAVAYTPGEANLQLQNASPNTDNLTMTMTGEFGLFSNGGKQNCTITPNDDADGYNKTVIGHMRKSLVFPTGYDTAGKPLSQVAFACPAPNATKPYLDMALQIVDDPASNDSLVTFSRIKQQAGTLIGAANWIESVPNTELLQGPGVIKLSAILGGGFTYGEDRVKISYEISANLQITVSLSHDDAGDGVFNPEVVIISTVSGRSFVSTIKESHYPLIPIVMSSGGGAGDKTLLRVNGHFDSVSQNVTSITNPYIEENIFHNDDQEVNFATNPKNNDLEETGITNISAYKSELDKGNFSAVKILGATLNLKNLFIFGKIDVSTDFIAGGGAIPNVFNTAAAGSNRITANNAAQSNMNNVLGMTPYISTVGGQPPPSIESTLELIFEALNPNLYIELPDFNIQSFNGFRGDIGRCIGMIPKEELSMSSADLGALSYSSAYQRPIDLGLSTDQTFYQIRARIRNARGEIETDLDRQTSLILYFTQPPASADSELLDRVKDLKKSVDEMKIQRGEVNEYKTI